ncbi:hypothetical protein ACFQ1S_18365 [Kibdelosporangium lantanae]|uniref:Uncharacterized protein n=1 Tax=Kibdelosporangium lantanae TaxID=1497396 RepID=A0ABW3MAS9_9PSEU
MSLVRSSDADFRVCQIGFDDLLAIQLDAENRGWATRWSSVDALRGQVGAGPVVLRPLLREERDGVLRAYRCLVMFSIVDDQGRGGVATVDVDPGRFESLDRIDRDPDVRKALVLMFSLAANGISTVAKK